MKLSDDDARLRLAASDHAILCTTHPERGIDAVPVCFAVHGDLVGVPIDLVKPKRSTQLQREKNLMADPRATLLVEHWNATDWSQLWWVRAELRWRSDPGTHAAELGVRLSERYPNYADEPFARVLVLEIVDISGWAASTDQRTVDTGGEEA